MATTAVQQTLTGTLASLFLPSAGSSGSSTSTSTSSTTQAGSDIFSTLGTVTSQALGLNLNPDQARTLGKAELVAFVAAEVGAALADKAEQEKKEAEVKQKQEEAARAAKAKQEAEDKRQAEELRAKLDEAQRREFWERMRLAERDSENTTLTRRNDRYERFMFLRLPAGERPMNA